MREIKFRAWYNNYMTYNYQDTYDVEVFGFSNSDVFKIMQYTGLKDQNGKEIYEGDVILKVTTGSLFEVYYSENTACFRVKRQDGWHFDLQEIFPINDWKVVGNIYEKFDWNI